MNPVQNEKGEWVIPATRRPDGTWRKEVVMKAGYVPQEEVKAFETTASKHAKKGIPGLAPVTAAPPKPKPEKKKEPVAAVTSSMEKLSVTPKSSTASAPVVEPEPVDPAVAAAKRLKALKKKLREIIDISQKKQEDLTPEQAEKLGKKNEIEAEINRLESSV